TVLAEPSIKFFPTEVEPVKLIFLTFEFSRSSFDMSFELPKIIFTTPSGIPTSSKISQINFADKEELEDGLKTTVHPTDIASAILRVIIDTGKFQGVIAPTTPTGCFITFTTLFLLEGIVSP